MTPPSLTEAMPGPLKVGDEVGNYTVTGLLGTGGMGVVYAGYHRRLTSQRVAIKVMQTGDTSDPRNIRRFLMEAETAASIEHDSIVTVLDLNTLPSGAPYMVMELMPGHDLAVELKKNGKMGVERATRLFWTCLGGLARAHEMGIVHKDLKPSNLFVKHPGTVDEILCIMDFGVARLIKDGGLTSTKAPAGTYKYMAPEYIEDTSNVSPAVDVYQMGLILVEVLTGQMPIAGMFRTGSNLNIPPQLLLKPVLGDLISRSTAFEPLKRFENAGEMRAALGAAFQSASGRIAHQAPAPTSGDGPGPTQDAAASPPTTQNQTPAPVHRDVGNSLRGQPPAGDHIESVDAPDPALTLDPMPTDPRPDPRSKAPLESRPVSIGVEKPHTGSGQAAFGPQEAVAQPPNTSKTRLAAGLVVALTALALIFAFVVTGEPPEDQGAGSPKVQMVMGVDEAIPMLLSAELSQAERTLKAKVEASPKEPLPHLALGLVHLLRGHDHKGEVEAEIAFRLAEKHSGPLAEMCLLVGELLTKPMSKEEIFSRWEALEQALPPDFALLDMLRIVMPPSGLEDKEKLVDAAIKDHPDSALFYGWKSQIIFFMGRPIEAAWAPLLNGLKKNPGSSWLRWHEALLLYMERDFGKARKILEDVLAVDGSALPARRLLTHLLLLVGDQEALAHNERILLEGPTRLLDRIEFSKQAGLVHASLGQVERSAQLLEKCVGFALEVNLPTQATDCAQILQRINLVWERIDEAEAAEKKYDSLFAMPEFTTRERSLLQVKMIINRALIELARGDKPAARASLDRLENLDQTQFGAMRKEESLILLRSLLRGADSAPPEPGDLAPIGRDNPCILLNARALIALQFGTLEAMQKIASSTVWGSPLCRMTPWSLTAVETQVLRVRLTIALAAAHRAANEQDKALALLAPISKLLNSSKGAHLPPIERGRTLLRILETGPALRCDKVEVPDGLEARTTSCKTGHVAWCDLSGKKLACCSRGLVPEGANGVCVCPPGGAIEKSAIASGCQAGDTEAWRKAFTAVIKEQRPRLKACDKRHNPDHSSKGTVSIQFDLTPDGRPVQARIARSGLPNAGMQRCLLSTLSGIIMPPPVDGYTAISYPFVFGKTQ